MHDDNLLSLRDVERRLGLSRWTLYSLIRRGALPAVRLRSGHYRVRADVVEAIVREEVPHGAASTDSASKGNRERGPP